MHSHVAIEPAILYLGTPVVLISTTNENGTANLAPMSSAFWLGWRAVLGLSAASKTAANLQRNGEGVLNLPSAAMAPAVDCLALTTGADPVPPYKVTRGYRHEPGKFELAGLHPVAAETVAPPRVGECPVNLEVVLADSHPLAAADDPSGSVLIFEMRVTRVHVHPEIRVEGTTDQIDPDRWRPLIMSFQRFYGLGDEIHTSRLATIPEASYRSPDVDRARAKESERASASVD